jgi:type I site-specific restriction endonuclease
MGLSEADTRAKLIDPALHSRGWTEDLIRREESPCAIKIIAEYAINSHPAIHSIDAQIDHCFNFHNDRHPNLKDASPV